MLQQSVSFSRRRTSRVETPDGVWVYWGCGRRDDVSRVRNLSPGGLFVETRAANVVGASTKLEFLVQEGQIRAEAIVRHVDSGRGVGLKFTAIRDEDCPHLAALLNRVKHSS
jgi:PilZ domain